MEINFPAVHLDRLKHILGEAIAPKTHEGWGASLLQFNQYCDSIGLPEEGQMPTSELLLALFVTNCAAGNISGSMVNKWINGIHQGHQIADAPWYGGQLLSQAKKGMLNLVPAMSQCEKCYLVTLRHLDAPHSQLDLSNSFDAAVYAIACVAFWACCHLGKLPIASHHSFDSKTNVTCGCLKTHGITRFGCHFSILHLPSTKTKGHDGDNIYLINCPLLSSPITVF